jgi:DNA ligase-1
MSRSGIMLCYPFEEKRIEKWGYPVIVQPKLDGERCRAKWDFEHGWYFLSSEENLIRSIPHIKDFFDKNFISEEHRALEFDGELYHHGVAFNELHSVIGRTKNLHEEHTLVEFHCFDLVDTELFQAERIGYLFRNFTDSEFFKLVPIALVENREELFALYEKFLELDYEGMIVRKIDGSYVRKRSTEIMKFKPRKTDHYEIVGYKQEKDKHGVPKNSLGAFICQTDGVEFSVGSGFTQEQRKVFWLARDSYIGRFLQINYQHTMKNAPRFGIFVRILDVNPEEHYSNIGIDF